MRRRVVGEVSETPYSSPEDALATAGALGLGGRGRYILAAGGWQGAAASTPGKRSSITPPTSSSATGQLGLLTVALVLITATLAARPR